ncbi:MAG: STAS domain-containing protein [Actinomycetota bacterium]|nr:STAS domain-containing protein [Actinomycetota bacterium]
MSALSIQPLDVPQFSVNVDVTARVLAVSGDVDLSTAPIMLDLAKSMLGGHPGDITIDFAGVTFMDSQCLNALVTIDTIQRGQHAALRLDNLNARHRRVFIAGGLSGMLTSRRGSHG